MGLIKTIIDKLPTPAPDISKEAKKAFVPEEQPDEDNA